MVFMASGFARGRVRTATTTTMTTAELCKMAAILQIIAMSQSHEPESCNLGLPCTSLIFDIHVMIN